MSLTDFTPLPLCLHQGTGLQRTASRRRPGDPNACRTWSASGEHQLWGASSGISCLRGPGNLPFIGPNAPKFILKTPRRHARDASSRSFFCSHVHSFSMMPRPNQPQATICSKSIIPRINLSEERAVSVSPGCKVKVNWIEATCGRRRLK